MSWRAREDKREDRWGGDRERHRPRSPVWELRSPSSDRQYRDNRYSRDRDRDRKDRYGRDIRDSRDRYDREKEHRRSPRRYESDRSRNEELLDPPSPPKISSSENNPESNESTRSESQEPTDVETNRQTNQKDDSLYPLTASPGDWYCRCGTNNFKWRTGCYRRNCNGKRSEGTIYGESESPPATSNMSGITKRLLFRRLDALTTEEKILDTLKETCSKDIIDSIAGITVGREPWTGASKCLAYINFNSIADSTAAYTTLTSLSTPLKIDDKEVLISYYNEIPKHMKHSKHGTEFSNYYNHQSYNNTQTSKSLSETDRVNAAAAVAQSAIASAQARQMASYSHPSTTVPAQTALKLPIGDGKTVYSPPDIRTFLYDESSGYYYDPATGLYYDGKTQYFFNNQTNEYMYWDSTSSTYIKANQAPQATEQAAVQPVVTENVVVKEPEEKKKRDKEDKVKVAKKIAKDMERWARTLNQKKENARNNFVMEQPLDTGASKGSADIGFSVLGAGPSLSTHVREISPPATDDFLIKKVQESPSFDEDEGIIDWGKLTCLLCKRKFPTVEVLTKHKTMSDLHKQNLVEFRKNEAEEELLPQINGYRDRAAERRMKFGEDDAPPMRKRYEAPDLMPPPVSHPPPSVVDTIGGKMLQKMGWQEGKGLGKTEQGRTAPIEAEQRSNLAGLGQKRGIYTPTPGETYRDTVKKLMIARYKEVVGQEDK